MTHELHRLTTALLPSTSTVHLTALTIEQASVVLQLDGDGANGILSALYGAVILSA
jgi:hypothetical protein